MKTILLIIGLTAVALVAFGVVHGLTTQEAVAPVTSSLSSVEGLTVTISGEVNRPGTYVLDVGSKLIDLINAASGTTSNADTLAFNTDYVLKTKGAYYIAPLYDNSNTCSASPISKVNINTATADALMATAGFSKSVANAIVSYRASSPFESLEDMVNVPGIGSATYMSTRDHLTLRDGK